MNPLSGDAFMFISPGANRIKLLQWQYDGFAIYYKRHENGTFDLPKGQETVTHINAQQFMEQVQNQKRNYYSSQQA